MKKLFIFIIIYVIIVLFVFTAKTNNIKEKMTTETETIETIKRQLTDLRTKLNKESQTIKPQTIILQTITRLGLLHEALTLLQKVVEQIVNKHPRLGAQQANNRRSELKEAQKVISDIKQIVSDIISPLDIDMEIKFSIDKSFEHAKLSIYKILSELQQSRPSNNVQSMINNTLKEISIALTKISDKLQELSSTLSRQN